MGTCVGKLCSKESNTSRHDIDEITEERPVYRLSHILAYRSVGDVLYERRVVSETFK